MAQNLSSSLTVRLIDGVSGPARAAAAAVRGIGAAASSISGKVASVAGATAMAVPRAMIADVRRATGAVSEFKNSLHSVGGLAVALAAADQFSPFVKYTEHMNRVRAATIASVGDMKALEDEIMKVSKQHAKVYNEVAEGALQLVKSGKDIHETIGALDATVGAAVAIEKSVGHTAETLTDIIYGMGLRVTNQAEAMKVFGDVADVAVAASFKFNQSYDEMSRALAKGAPMARVTGLTLAEIATFAGLSADENFKGAKAGAALASSFIRLMAPVKKARAELAAAGIDLSQFQHATKEASLGGSALASVLNEEVGVDADALIPKFDKILKDPQLKGNATMLGKALQAAVAEGLEMDANSPNIEKAREAVDTFVRSAFSKMDMVAVFRELAAKDADTNISLMNELFGKHHAPAMIALINAFRQGLWDRQKKLLDEQTPGAVKRHEHENLQGLSGALLKLHAAWKLLGATLLTKGGVADMLVRSFTAISDAIDTISEAGPNIKKFAGYTTMAVASGVALGLAFEVLKFGAAGLKLALLPLTSVTGALVTALGALAYYKWDKLKVRMQAFGEGFSKGFWDNLKMPSDLAQNWKEFTNNLRELTGLNLNINSWKEAGELLGTIFAGACNTAAHAVSALLSGINELSKAIKDLSNLKMPSLSVPGWDGGLGLGGSNNPLAGVPKRAAGGPVSSGGTYLVGENGPELFTASRSGRIIANGGAARASSGRMSFSVGQIVIHGASNAREIADQVAEELEARLRRLTRGLQADLGYTS
jgi:hypothetical protein